MTSRDIHNKPFEEGTITKLDLFEKYFEAWLPVFIHTTFVNEVYICDFFAGPGKDTNGTYGSPLRFLRTLLKFKNQIIENNLKVNLILNEFENPKFLMLEAEVNNWIARIGNFNNLLNIEKYNKDFFELFEEIYPRLTETANLLFFDQNGYKFITPDILQNVCKLNCTDFIFFVSSSYGYRFKDVFSKFVPDFEAMLDKIQYDQIHDYVTDCFQQVVSEFSDYSLYPFSIKKGSNIYGLIFGSQHPKGIDKFLEIAWKENPSNGKANYDIAHDAETIQLTIFGKVLTKIEKFQYKLEKLILSQELSSNCDVYFYTLKKGHPKKHSIEVVKKLKKDHKIVYSGQPKINFKNCYKNEIEIRFELNEKN